MTDHKEKTASFVGSLRIFTENFPRGLNSYDAKNWLHSMALGFLLKETAYEPSPEKSVALLEALRGWLAEQDRVKPWEVQP